MGVWLMLCSAVNHVQHITHIHAVCNVWLVLKCTKCSDAYLVFIIWSDLLSSSESVINITELIFHCTHHHT